MTQEAGDRKRTCERNGVLDVSRFSFSLGAGVTPAQGSVKPTAGFTFNQVLPFAGSMVLAQWRAVWFDCVFGVDPEYDY
jgi:hypothetical protein